MIPKLSHLVKKTKKHYETVPFSIEYFRETIFLHSLTYNFIKNHNLKNKKIVEIGCSTSFIGRWLKKNYPKYNYIGFDINRNALKIAKDFGVNVKFGNNIDLELKNSIADLVISEGVIHHTPDPYKSFTELVRITKKGGYISLYVYNKNHLYYYVYKIIGFPCRLVHSNKITRPLSEHVIFPIFNLFYVQLANKVLLRNKTFVPKQVSYSMYYDQILTPVAHFFTRKDIKNWAKENDLDVIKIKKSINGQGNMYLLKKN